jgi:ABC-type sugar transport system substrate-binding protein
MAQKTTAAAWLKRAGMGALAATVAMGLAGSAFAQEMTGGKSSAELRQKVEKALHGKTIAWVPVALGVPLTDIWTKVMKEEAEQRGMKFVVRDPNWNSSAELQAVSALIADHPDVMVVHNPNVQLLAKELKRAEEAGIFVIQVNMVSNYKTDSYVGANWWDVGRTVGEDMVKQCGTGSGKSGKVAIIQGELTSAASIEQLAGTMDALNKDKAIKVVSSQAANWDATKAHDIMETVLQQHPDLCATFGFWGVMQAGAAQAIKAAGKLDQIKVYASGGDGKLDCENVDNGLFYKFLSYDSPSQARAIIQLATFMLQSGQKPGTFRTANFSTLTMLEKGKYDKSICYDLGAK